MVEATWRGCAGIAGYVSGVQYKLFGGTNWVRNVLLTATIFCGPLLLVFSFLNTVAIVYRVRLLRLQLLNIKSQRFCWYSTCPTPVLVVFAFSSRPLYCIVTKGCEGLRKYMINASMIHILKSSIPTQSFL